MRRLASSILLLLWAASAPSVAESRVVLISIDGVPLTQPADADGRYMRVVNSAFTIVQDTGTGGSYPISSDRVAWALGAYQANPDRRKALLIGVCVALGFAIRPTFVWFAVGPILWLLAKRPRHLVLAAVPATLGSAMFAWLTVVASGGVEVYRQATEALVTQTILRAMSVARSMSLPAPVEISLNFSSSATWAAASPSSTTAASSRNGLRTRNWPNS